MKRSFFLLGIIVSLLIMSGCLFGSKYYSLSNYEKDPTLKVVTMKTVDENSDEFTFRWDTKVWDLEVWEVEKAPNRVALVDKTYPEGDCYVLPGTVGQGYQEGWIVTEGALLTRLYTARSLLISNEVGIIVKYVAGFEIEGGPYIFEVNFPIKDQDTCSADAQALISSFNADLPEIDTTTDTTGETDSTPNSDEIVTQDPTLTETPETSTDPVTEGVVQ